MGSGRAGRDGRVVRSFETMFDRDIPGGNVRYEHRDKERRDSSRSALHVRSEDVVVGDHAPDPRAEDDADAIRVDLLGGNAGIGNCLICCDHGILGERVHTLERFPIHVVGGVKPLQLARKVGIIRGGVEIRDGSCAAFPCQEGLPEVSRIQADRRKSSDPCDDNSAFSVH